MFSLKELLKLLHTFVTQRVACYRLVQVLSAISLAYKSLGCCLDSVHLSYPALDLRRNNLFLTYGYIDFSPHYSRRITQPLYSIFKSFNNRTHSYNFSELAL